MFLLCSIVYFFSLFMCLYIYIYMYVYVCVYVRACVCVCACVRACVCMGEYIAHTNLGVEFGSIEIKSHHL